MDDQYQPGIPVPGIRFGGQVRSAWQRVFGGWRPDLRTVGVLLVALYLGLLANRLLIADLTWRNFTTMLQSPSPFRPVLWQQSVTATTAMLSLPTDAIVLLGGVALALRRAWGQTVAVGGLALVLSIALVNAVTYLTGGAMLRSGIGEVLLAVGTALPLVVLFWSRPGSDAA